MKLLFVTIFTCYASASLLAQSPAPARGGSPTQKENGAQSGAKGEADTVSLIGRRS